MPPVKVEAPALDGDVRLAESYPVNAAARIDQQELESSQRPNINEELRGLAGVSLMSASPGRASYLRLRGAVAGQGLILLDDIPMPVSLPGTSWLDTLPSESLGEVQVLRGTDHSDHVAQGAGGTIKLYSKSAEENYIAGHVEGGSLATLRETLSLGGRNDWGQATLTGSRINLFDGMNESSTFTGNERDPFGSTLGLLHYSATPNNSVALDGSVFYRDSWTKFDLPFPNAKGDPSLLDDKNTFLHGHTLMLQDRATVNVTPDWVSRLQLGYVKNWGVGSFGPIGSTFSEELAMANWRNTHRLFSDTSKDLAVYGVWGGETRHEWGEGETPLLNRLSRLGRIMVAGFAEARLDWGAWHHEAGIRVESYQQQDPHTAMHFGSRWQVTPEVTLRGSAGTVFRMPSFGELLIPLVGNPSLPPERGLNSDLGIDWQPSKDFKLSLTGFYSRYNDMTTMAADPFFLYRYQWIPRARLAGIESSATQRWSPQWSSGADFTWQQTKNLDTGSALPMLPEKSGRFWVEWQHPQTPLSVRLTAQYRGTFWNSTNGRYPIDDVVRLNAMATYKVSPQFDVYVRGENLNGERTSDALAMLTPGTTVYGGFHFRY